MKAEAERHGPRHRLTLARSLLVVGSIMLVLAVAEVGLRGVADAPWYERLPEEQNRFKFDRIELEDTAFVMRRPPPESPKAPGTQRILFIGDSFTYGQGVPEDRSFVSLLEDRLNAQASPPGPARFELFNGGIPGSYTDRWAKLFDLMAEKYQPDHVVIVFFLRDGVARVSTMQLVSDIRERMLELSRESLLYRYSHLYRFFRQERAQRELSVRYLAKLERGVLGSAKETEEWRKAQGYLRHLRDGSRRLGADFTLVIFPVLFGLDESYPLIEVMREIERFASAEGIPALSLLPAYTGRSAPDLWVSPLDQHPNEAAHEIAAEAIHDYIQRGDTR